jgi:hypothetical protein
VIGGLDTADDGSVVIYGPVSHIYTQSRNEKREMDRSNIRLIASRCGSQSGAYRSGEEE